MTAVALPYLNKLSGTYSKKVTFKNLVCVSHNNYIRKMGNGLACVTTEYSLKYIGLTDVELQEMETLFSTHDLNSFIEFKSPIDAISATYRKPVGWKKESYTELLGTTGAVIKERRHNVTFSLVRNLSTDEILNFMTKIVNAPNAPNLTITAQPVNKLYFFGQQPGVLGGSAYPVTQLLIG